MTIAKAATLTACVLSVTSGALAAQQQTSVRVPTSVLEQYVGEWVYPDGATINVTVKGETMYREITGQQVPFIPISESLFRLGPVFTAEFVTDQKGGITQVLTDGAATEFRLRRKGSPMAALPGDGMPTVQVPRALLERYVGTYEYVSGQMKRTDLRIEVRLKGDKLTTNAGGIEVSLLPVSETRFKVGQTSLMVEFVVDEAGVTQVMGSGFQQMLARLMPKR